MSTYLLESGVQIVAGQRVALNVLIGLHFLCQLQSFIGRYRHTAVLSKAFHYFWVVSRCLFETDQDSWHVRINKFIQLRVPFQADVLKRCPTDNREDHQEYVCLGITKWSKSVVVLLAGRVPKGELIKFSIKSVSFPSTLLERTRLVFQQIKIFYELLFILT